MPNRSLCWIRRDLRLSDHRALFEACQNSDSVAVVFIFDRVILDKLEDQDDRRMTFIHKSLLEVDAKLRARGSRLVVGIGDPVDLIPKIAAKLGATEVYANEDYEPYAIQRDALVGKQVGLHLFKDQVVFEKDEVLSQQGTPMRVFTPYKKQWMSVFQPHNIQEFSPDLIHIMPFSEIGDEYAMPTLGDLSFTENSLWLEPGEDAAQARLASFTSKIAEYKAQRDFFGVDGTSGLSVHLRHGTISIRQCFRVAEPFEGSGPDCWRSELIWREFYMMILHQFPHVVHGAFRPELDTLEWPGTEEHFELWCQGQTGYPIVDAAMRCFNATGWMHNRLRMLTAMFLTKDLLCNWKWGEAYFARKLLDFDLAANNGGWQWSASTGVDAQPYFRVFNPLIQSRKFDPTGGFIREWVPELAHLDDEDIHWPHEGLFAPNGYPAAIVDHHKQKELAIAMFKAGQ